MTLTRWPIPNNWNWVQAAEVATIAGGGTPSTKDERNFAEPGSGIPWIGPADLTRHQGAYISRGRRDLSAQGLASSGATILPRDAVLFSSRAPIGYCAIAANPLSTNQGFKTWITDPGLLPEYVRYYLLASVQYIDGLASGTTFREISGRRMESVALPLPPTGEQRRIIAKLDKFGARYANFRRSLGQAADLLQSLRTSATRQAFLGLLTQDWRRDENSAAAHALGRGTLPLGWRWETLGQIADIRSGITLGRRYPPDTPLLERPYLRVANVQRGRLDLSHVKTINVTAKEADQLSLRVGDILMNEGGDRDKLGRGWVWDGQIPECIHQNHVFRVRLNSSNDIAKYVSYYANEFGQEFFFEQGTQTTNLASISKAKLSGLFVPLAPPDEQAEIVRRLDDLFARADRLEAEANRALALLDRLEAAILDKAFRGELVPQDPDDEPASVMLERIRAARATEKPPRRRRAAASPAY